MGRGEEPAFPTNRAGHSPEPGMCIREYVAVEILAALIAGNVKRSLDLELPWMVAKSYDAADLWLAQREKRPNAAKAQ